MYLFKFLTLLVTILAMTIPSFANYPLFGPQVAPVQIVQTSTGMHVPLGDQGLPGHARETWKPRLNGSIGLSYERSFGVIHHFTDIGKGELFTRFPNEGRNEAVGGIQSYADSFLTYDDDVAYFAEAYENVYDSSSITYPERWGKRDKIGDMTVLYPFYETFEDGSSDLDSGEENRGGPPHDVDSELGFSSDAFAYGSAAFIIFEVLSFLFRPLNKYSLMWGICKRFKLCSEEKDEDDEES